MSQGPRPRNRSRSRWLTLAGVPASVGLLALSLAPAAIGQAASPAVSAAPQVPVSAAAASSASAAGSRVSPASALTFTNRTTANGLGSNNVLAVYVTDDTVYAGTTGGLSISTDGGATFTNRTTANGLGSNVVIAVHVTGDTVYAGTTGGLSISMDGGATFTSRTTIDGLLDNDVYSVSVVGSKVYAATGSGLSLSTNGGVSFTTALSGMRVWSVYAVDDTVLAGTDYQGLKISSDGGATFTTRTTADGLGADNQRGVYATGGTLYLATMNGFIGYPGTGGMSMSTDGGATFTNDDTTSGLGSDELYGVYVTGGTIYAATRGGLSISSDGGATYTNYSTSNSAIGSNEVIGVFAKSGIVYAATDSGLSISGSTAPALSASPTTTTVMAGATTTVAISSTALPIPDDTVISAVSAAPGVATVTSSVNASGGTAAFAVTGVSSGTSNVTFSATGYASVVVPVTVTAPGPGPGPGPVPVFPPSPPLAVTGVAGDGSVGLSWTAPASNGSFAVTKYQAMVEPGGHSCLASAPELTCTISGLTNGTAYTATVRALNGAGWSSWSDSSAVITPRPAVVPSIMITGTRGEVRGKSGVVVTGTTTGFGMGAILRPWIRFPGQTSYTQGTTSILVDLQDGFMWERRTGKTIYISIRSEDGSVVSNRLILRTT